MLWGGVIWFKKRIIGDNTVYTLKQKAQNAHGQQHPIISIEKQRGISENDTIVETICFEMCLRNAFNSRKNHMMVLYKAWSVTTGDDIATFYSWNTWCIIYWEPFSSEKLSGSKDTQQRRGCKSRTLLFYWVVASSLLLCLSPTTSVSFHFCHGGSFQLRSPQRLLRPNKHTKFSKWQVRTPHEKGPRSMVLTHRHPSPW